MSKCHKMGRRHSRSDFSRKAGRVHGKNAIVMRGGIRF